MTAHERTGWRDKEFSLRHRDWGFDCPAIDIDFLMLEYNHAVATAIVEYKMHQCKKPNLEHPSYEALLDLANNYKTEGLPFFITIYSKKPWQFEVWPVNHQALELFKNKELFSEREYVLRLYEIRGEQIEDKILSILDTEKPKESIRIEPVKQLAFAHMGGLT